MAKRNVIAALALLAFCIWYAMLTWQLPDRTLPNTPGPSFFPTLIVAIALALSVALLVRGALQFAGAMPAAPAAHLPGQAVWMLVLFAAYLAALPYAGFELASVPFFAALIVLFGSRSILAVVIAGVAVPLALGFLFRQVFQIILPNNNLW